MGISGVAGKARHAIPIDSFVGREAELAALAERAAQAASGTPAVLVVAGQAGIGKTALVRRALGGLEGFCVWWASCDPAEQDWPFGVIDQWMSQVERGQLQDRGVLSGRLGPGASPLAVGMQVLDLLGAMQDKGPVILVVDDLQWADEASLRVLSFVSRRLWADKVLILATARTGPQDALFHSEGVLGGERWWRLVQDAPSGQTLILKGLSRAQVAALAADVSDERGGLSQAVVQDLWERTRGHPLHVRSILADPRWNPRATATEQHVPATLAAAVHHTLQQLPPDSRRLVDAIAVLNTSVPLALAAQVAGLANPTEALGPLLASALVAWEPTEPSTPVRISHVLQRDSVYEAISPEERRALHTAAVPIVDEDTGWAHRVAAAQHVDADLADALEAEAARKASDGYLNRAATLLLWAASLSPSRQLHERRLLTAATHALTIFKAGSNRMALALRQAVEDCAPCALRTLLQSHYAFALDRDPASAVKLCEHALLETEAGELAVSRSRIWESLALFLIHSGAFARAAELARQALSQWGTEERNVFNIILTYSTVLLDGPEAVLGKPWITALPDDPARVSVSDIPLLVHRGWCRVLTGDLHSAKADLMAVLACDGSKPVARIQALKYLGPCEYLLGDWSRASAHAEQAIIEGDINGAIDQDTPCHTWTAVIAAGQGRWQRAQEHLDASRLLPLPLYTHHPAIAAAAIAQARGDPAAVLRALQPVHDHARTMRLTEYDALYWPMLTEALINSGQLGQAHEALAHLRDLAAEVPLLKTITAFTAGQLAEASGDPQTAAATYQQILDQPPGPNDPPLHRARLEYAAGHLHLTRGDHNAARPPLEQARNRYTNLDARPFLEILETDLAAFDVHTASPRLPAEKKLTDRECDVALLAAQGHTNREIAQQLYLSTKTVEYHLSHVYTKLAITSRRQLRTIFGDASRERA